MSKYKILDLKNINENKLLMFFNEDRLLSIFYGKEFDNYNQHYLDDELYEKKNYFYYKNFQLSILDDLEKEMIGELIEFKSNNLTDSNNQFFLQNLFDVIFKQISINNKGLLEVINSIVEFLSTKEFNLEKNISEFLGKILFVYFLLENKVFSLNQINQLFNLIFEIHENSKARELAKWLSLKIQSSRNKDMMKIEENFINFENEYLAFLTYSFSLIETTLTIPEIIKKILVILKIENPPLYFIYLPHFIERIENKRINVSDLELILINKKRLPNFDFVQKFNIKDLSYSIETKDLIEYTINDLKELEMKLNEYN